MHQNACAEEDSSYHLMPHHISMKLHHAIALKPTHEAGRRGGESTARQTTFTHLFSQPERVAEPRGFVRVLVGDAGAFEGIACF